MCCQTHAQRQNENSKAGISRDTVFLQLDAILICIPALYVNVSLYEHFYATIPIVC